MMVAAILTLAVGTYTMRLAGVLLRDRLDLSGTLHRLLPMAVDIGNLRILSHPKAAVHAASQMLGEMTVEFGSHQARLLGEIDTDPLIVSG